MKRFNVVRLEPFVIMVVVVSMVLEVAALLVIGNEGILDENTGSMGVQIVGHVVTLGLHVVTELVERRSTDHVALTIDLPGDRSILGADLVVTGGTSGGSGVVMNILSVFTIHNPSSHHVRVEVRFVVDNGENLGLDSNSRSNILGSKGREGLQVKLAENTIVERSLVLVNFSAGSGGRVRPVNLVGLSDLHTLAVFPVVFGGELRIFGVVVVATESSTDILLSKAALGGRDVSVRTVPILVILSDRVVLGSQMPVHVDWAHGALPVVLGVGYDINFHTAHVSLGDVGTSLRTWKVDAVNVFELGIHVHAGILSLREDGFDIVLFVVRHVRHGTLHGEGSFGGTVVVLVHCKGDGRSEEPDGGDNKDDESALELRDFITLSHFGSGSGSRFFRRFHGCIQFDPGFDYQRSAYVVGSERGRENES